MDIITDDSTPTRQIATPVKKKFAFNERVMVCKLTDRCKRDIWACPHRGQHLYLDACDLVIPGHNHCQGAVCLDYIDSTTKGAINGIQTYQN
ncbi:MAG: hypothetical protein A4E59_00379 [Syntrophorhabdus sp. PtaB.Bin027]|nr:MAG: hypothetical protein A4E59_00379 [Syntrophorhabdus sp. PtaB.Bin027]